MPQDPSQYGQPPAPGYAQQGYPQEGYPQGSGQQAYPPPTNAMAILSLVFVFLFWPLAIIFGHIARSQIARTGESGRGLATAGLVIGYVFLGLTALAIIAVVILVFAVGV